MQSLRDANEEAKRLPLWAREILAAVDRHYGEGWRPRPDPSENDT